MLILLVVLWHVIMKSYLQLDWQLGVPIPGGWGLVGDAIWPFLMPLFLLVSGYFAANALARPWAQVLRPRVVRFLYLYLLWSLIHMVALWAFPDFPTLVPRSVSQFVESVTISPPDTWYLYALALYFVLAKALSRLPRWLLVSLAAALSVAVSAGYVEIVSNRGSLLYNVTFFLLGAFFAPQLHGLLARVTPWWAVLAVLVYAVGFGAMRLTGTEETPGVWPLVSVLGCAMGLAAATQLARIRALGPGLAWLGRRTLPIYLLHMPLLALIDLPLSDLLATARPGVQLAAAALLPIATTALLVPVCVLLDRILVRDGLTWLFDLPRRRIRRPETAPVGEASPVGGEL